MSLFSSDKSKSSGTKDKPAGSKKRARKGNSQKTSRKKRTSLDDVSCVCVLDVTLVF